MTFLRALTGRADPIVVALARLQLVVMTITFGAVVLLCSR